MTIFGNIILLLAYFCFIILLLSILYILGVTNGLIEGGRFKDLAGKIRIPSLLIRNINFKLLLEMTLFVAGTRLVILLISYMGWIYFHGQVPASFWDVQRTMWGGQWDANHYLLIAEHGYVSADPQKQLLILFPPLYPQLIKILWFVIRDYFWSGFILANVFTIVSSFFLYKLVNLDFHTDTAYRAVKYLLVFPFSFFLMAVYSESLFLALSIIAIYMARKERWFLSGIAGLLAAITKSHGLLVMVLIGVEYIVSKNVVRNILNKNFKLLFRDFGQSGIYIFLIPLGFLFYIFLNKVLFDDWFYFQTFLMKERFVRFLFAPENLREQWKSIFDYVKDQPLWPISIWVPQIITFFLVAGLLFFSLGRIRISYIIYLFIYLFNSYSVYWMLSGPRYMLIIFPIYIILALVCKRKYLDFLIMFLFVALLSIYTIAFTQGKQVL